MNDTKLQESQQELFSNFIPERRPHERIPSIAKSQKPILISTTLEQVLLAVIVLILVFCLIFFLGVLRGRAINASSFTSKPVPTAVIVAAPRPLAASRAPVSPVANVPKIAQPAAVIRQTGVKPYTIQVLTTKKRGYADSEAETIKKSGFASWVMPSSDYFVVCVGAYSNKQEARRDLAYFSARYRGSYLRRR